MRQGQRSRRREVCAAAAAVLLLAGCYGNSTQKVKTTSPGSSDPPPGPVGTQEPPGPCQQAQDPGRVSLHRLNRAEYDNTVRDLLGDTSQPAQDFPADDISSAGFDNDAEVLSMSPLLLEKYSAAATELVEEAWTKGTVRSCELRAEAPMPCARELLSRFARRAWRRPVETSEVQRLLSFVTLAVQQGDSADTGVKLALRAVLLSPHFLFRVELDPAPGSPTPHRLTDLELASRLAYFLWSSTPDEPLQALAEAGRLREPEVLEQQVRRMLADPKSSALIDNFTGQWLNVRGLKTVEPVVNIFPDFDDNLRSAFQREAELFFDAIVHEDHSALDLLTADYTFVNERLARHYGIPNIYGSQFRRVTLPPELDVRRGLLGKGALLTVTSNAARTSPVTRGKWFQSTFLGVAPPDPPPGVDTSLKEKVTNDASGNLKIPSMRDVLDRHHANPVCASCHKIFEPIGLAFENFDATGAFRTLDEGNPIDATATMIDGTKVDGVVGLRGMLVKYQDQFLRVATEKLLTYALGRGVEDEDMPTVRAIVRGAAPREYRMSSLILGIVKSDQFQMNQKTKS